MTLAAIAGLPGFHHSGLAEADDAVTPTGERSPQEQIGVGIIGAGGRGNELALPFSKAASAKIVAVADPDQQRARLLAAKYDATPYSDLRALLENDSVDVVVIATCNHWHCLAAIYAMQAGKDVYVEKPLSHNVWEGQQVVAAARHYGKIVQVGTQQRSDPMQASLKEFLHTERGLGSIAYVQANRLGVREPLGKRSEPLSIDSQIDFDLWLGPAADQPILRNALHYDWHWDWNTGNGEMGNWGIHVLDDVRNVAYQDSVIAPHAVATVGGRVFWDDAGETPNVHYGCFLTESFPTFIALSNLPSAPDKPKSSWNSKGNRPQAGPGSGYVVVCEGGYLLGQRGSAKALDLQGKIVREFRGGDMMRLHVENFLHAVRRRDHKLLNTDVELGHHSTMWCNLANIAFRTSQRQSAGGTANLSELPGWQGLSQELTAQLGQFELSSEQLFSSGLLSFDAKESQFQGEGAELANGFLQRSHRSAFAFPRLG
jgi:predicted dehydrogenase